MALTIGGSPLPGFGYLIAVGVLACATAVAGAVVPAVAASRRDPLTELRVP
jgi:putative ABC transport system permease protein